ncbi:MAG TPA: RNA polymerase subunit sigma-70 [Chitinophagaceae bacterium]|nr:RNA polymerase subunit sigma-70 [Chitinophagaceae bacterium]HAN38364.1 RNA polymerase subunit sigma-70 [Chitinophagaceae bacterium]
MEEHELIRLCLRHDPKAQRMLYDSYASAMLGVCYRYTKNVTDAQDVLQEGFVKVFTKLHQYQGTGSIAGWIKTIMVHSAISYLRKQKLLTIDVSEALNNAIAEQHQLPDVPLATKQVAEAIRALPTGYQTIFNLYAVEGYSHAEIAQMLGISEGTSRSQYARARAILQQQLLAAIK